MRIAINIVRSFFSILFCVGCSYLSAQPTVGLIEHTDMVSEGYVLFTPFSSFSTYLIDNCGREINSWDGLTANHTNQAYLKRDGNLLRSTFNKFEIRSWENELLWSYNIVDLGLMRHHDFLELPNGNILFIASKYYSNEAMVATGRDPDMIGIHPLWQGFALDGIYEIKPVGDNTVELVWQWNFFHHLVQDYDSSKENYDDPENQPRKLDVNFKAQTGSAFDWLHCNGLDYNETLDQIIISSRNTCELYVIDHSTTAYEATTSTGGDSGYGGDFLWRWGNTSAYQEDGEQLLWQQHDPKWAPPGTPNENKISIFNNRANFDFNGEQNYSTVHLIEPVVENGMYQFGANNQFLPSDFDFSYTDEVVTDNFWGRILSSVQSMENGNLFICQGTIGEMLEINSDQEQVWIYQNPVREFIHSQGANPLAEANSLDLFIATKYAPNFEGLQMHDLSPGPILENENLVSQVCDPNTASIDILTEPEISIFPNPTTGILSINGIPENALVNIYDVFGNVLLKKMITDDHNLDISLLPTGMYFLGVFDGVGEVLFFEKVVIGR